MPPAGRFANLIVASSCYHVILACLIARDARFAGPSLLALNVGREQVAALYEPLKQAADRPFADVMCMPRPPGRKPARERAQGRWLAELDASVRPERVIVFNDLTPDVQLLCRRARARGAHTFCGEDGGAAYSSRSWAAPWKRHLQRVLRFGPWIENVAASGSSRHVEVFLAMHTELVRPELQGKPVWPLAADALPDLLAQSWVDGFLAHFGVMRAELVCHEVYAPANIRDPQARERLRERVRTELLAAREAGRDCIVKYHPRIQEDFLEARALGARVLPSAIPVELIYLASGRRLDRVIGDRGTTLLSARWLAPHARTLSALELIGMEDPWYARTLDRLGVGRLT